MMDISQEDLQEAEFLRKRIWDFIDKLEKLESALQSTIDVEKRKGLQARIKNTRRLLDDYQYDYEKLCEEVGLTQENFTPNAPSRDIASNFSRKSEKTIENLKSGKKIDIPPFFSATVPSRNPKFTGRQAEVTEFIQRVLQGGAFAICGVKGMGGIGKSEIAKEVCHLFHQTWQTNPQLPDYVADILPNNGEPLFRDGILWIQFEPEAQTPKSLIAWLLPKLVSPQTVEKIQDLDGLVNALESKDILIVLDSVEQNLRTFDYVLERFKGKFPLIITSRVAIPGIHARDINMLNDAEAEALFIAHLQNPEINQQQQEIIRELCRLQGNYPLLIRNTASLVKEDHSNLAILKTQYQDNPVLLLNEPGQQVSAEQRHAIVKTCFGISYDSLAEPEQQAFLHSALFNNPFTVEALAALLGIDDQTEIQHVTNRLVKYSMLNELAAKDGKTTTYELHPLMREFALDLLLKNVATIPGKKEQIAALLESLKAAEKQQILQDRLQDRDLVKQASEAMQYSDRIFDFDTVLKLMFVLNDALNYLGYWDEKIILNQLAIRAAVASQNRFDEAFWHTELADTLSRKAVSNIELQASYQGFQHALKIYRELKRKDGILFAQYRLADIDYQAQHWDKAVRNNYQGIREALRYGNSYNLGAFLKSLGAIQEDFALKPLGQLYYLNSKLKFQNIRQDWQRSNALLAYEDMINALYIQGYVTACIPLYKHKLKLAKSLNVAGLITDSIEDLFKCALHQQNSEACEQYLNVYQKLSTQMGLATSEKQDIQGRYAWLKGDYSTAIQLFSAAKAENDLNPAYYDYWLGKSYLYQGELEQAEVYLNQTLEHHRSDKNAVEIAKVYSQLALMYAKHGEAQQAAETFAITAKTQQSHEIILSPEEQQIEQAIREQLGNAGYESIFAQADPIDLQPDFILPELPQNHIGKDGKQMLLVPEGSAFIGKGAIEQPSTQELLANVEKYLFPYRQHSGKYQVPEHPDSTFDDDQLAFLLENSQSHSEQEKLEILAKIPETPESEIQQLLNKLDNAYQQANPKAIEIYLYPYYIDQDPVSNAEYAAFCKATQHPYPTHWVDDQLAEKAANLPVVNISLEDAKAYATWVDKEIPTAAEWEKACRGELGAIYPWGNEWEASKVKVGDGSIGKSYVETYTSLNNPDETSGILNIGDKHYFEIPSHPLSDFNDENFLNLLECSISLSLQEKQQVIDAIPRLSQEQINDLISIFTEEKSKFSDLEKEHPKDVNKLKKSRYLEFKNLFLFDALVEHVSPSRSNQSCYGIHDLVGNIAHMTITETNERFSVKGGSWFSENPEESCKAWSEEWIRAQDKRMDVGFRCVKPIFGREDLVDILPDGEDYS